MTREAQSAEEPGAILAAAMDFHRTGRFDEAERAYGQFLALVEDHPRALRLRGILARERGDFAASARWLRRATEVAVADPEPAAELGLSYLAAGYLGLAENALRKALERDPGSSKARANLGALHLYRGHLDEAIACYRQVLEAEPSDLEVRCNLANALLEAGQGTEALAELDVADGRAPGHALLLAVRGAVLVGLDQYASAAEVLARALALQPADDMALINLGQALRMLGDRRGAVDVLSRAVAVNPDNARATADLGNLLAAGGRLTEALDLCGRFLARHPGERQVLAVHAQALRDGGRADEAQGILDLERLIVVEDLPRPANFDSPEVFHGALRDLVMQAPSLTSNPRSKSTRGGRQTGELDPDAAPALAALRDGINRAVKALIHRWSVQGLGEHAAMAPASPRWTLRLWGTVLEAGGYQTPHMHPLGWLSGVYYVELPEALAVEADAGDGPPGWLEFGAPPERLQVCTPPELRVVEPRAGRLVLFPSYFHHRTIPFASSGTRISIAFDVMPVRGIPT